MAKVVGFTGPRDLSVKFSALVGAVVQHYAREGFEVAVGDAARADSFVAFRARQAGVEPVVFRVPKAVEVSWCPLRQYEVKRVIGSRYKQELRLVGVRVMPEPVLLPGNQVKVVSQVQGGRTPGNLAARSIRQVGYVCRAEQRVFVGFVSSPCPVQKRRGGGQPLYPSHKSGECFAGYGSGTWASLAYAAGLGCKVIVFLCGVGREALPSGWGRWVPAAPSGPLSGGWRLVR